MLHRKLTNLIKFATPYLGTPPKFQAESLKHSRSKMHKVTSAVLPAVVNPSEASVKAVLLWVQSPVQELGHIKGSCRHPHFQDVYV